MQIKSISEPSTAGKKVFQVRLMRRSYRMRGRVPRIQIKQNAKKQVLALNKMSPNPGTAVEERNSLAENILIARILVYSAIKISAKGPLLYSVLKPETSSDSPSAWSKGVRFVSANMVTNQINIIGRINNPTHLIIENAPLNKLNELNRRTVHNKIRDILTSYEIVCATPRNAPIRAYFELEDQPALRVV